MVVAAARSCDTEYEKAEFLVGNAQLRYVRRHASPTFIQPQQFAFGATPLSISAAAG
jgi:hypothetical protein